MQLELNPARFDPGDLIAVLRKAAIERTGQQLGTKKVPAEAKAAVNAALA